MHKFLLFFFVFHRGSARFGGLAVVIWSCDRTCLTLWHELKHGIPLAKEHARASRGSSDEVSVMKTSMLHLF